MPQGFPLTSRVAAATQPEETPSPTGAQGTPKSRGPGGTKPLRFVLQVLTAVGAVCTGGILYGLAFPPYDQSGAAWVALVPLLLWVRERSGTRAFLFGAAYGLASAVSVGAWLAPTIARFFGVPLIVGLLGASLYWLTFWSTAFGLFAAGAARLLSSSRPMTAAFTTAALWVASEFLRGRIMGHPWCLLGYSQHAHVALIQVAALTAVYGVSFLLALVNTAIAEAIAATWSGRGLADALRPLAVATALVATVCISGAVVAGPHMASGMQMIAIVQSNVPPARLWTRAYTDHQIATHTRMMDDSVPASGTALVVWPENAVPRYLEVEPGLAAFLGALAQRHDSNLLFGTLRYQDGQSYNSVQLITAAGRNGGHYDKQRLVVFAEVNPLHPATRGDPSENPGQFTAGGGPDVLPSFVPLGVSICQELLFPEAAARAARAGAALLVNVANDGWLDPETGMASRRLFAMAVFRAVETRRYLIRAATTGVSGVFDPYGRIVASLPYGEAGVLFAWVDGQTTTTPYVRLGDAFAMGCVAVAAAALFWRHVSLTSLRQRLAAWSH
jgi:apolipoprotein N-acyltransferase